MNYVIHSVFPEMYVTTASIISHDERPCFLLRLAVSTLTFNTSTPHGSGGYRHGKGKEKA